MPQIGTTITTLALVCLLGAKPLGGQQPTERPGSIKRRPAISFDSVSIKPSRGDGFPQIRGKQDADFISIIDMPLRSIIYFALDITSPDLLSGAPKWTEAERYDVYAKVSDLDYPQFRVMPLTEKKLMLQAVLADRFKLRFHPERRPVGVFDLVVSKGGVRMKQVAAVADATGGSYFSDGEPNFIRGAALSLPRLSQILTSLVGKQVVDKTGLPGAYDFKLRWDASTSANAPHQPGTDSTMDSESPDPPILTAIQDQLGLKLQPSKVSMQVIVIDSIERPSEN
jgi:uncharacterized protein (TIGR03435 family)